MISFDEIIQKRTVPGLLVFDQKNELVYISAEAREVLEKMGKKEGALKSVPPIPDEIFRLCESSNRAQDKEDIEKASSYIIFICDSELYSARAVPLFRSTRAGSPSHTMIIIEKCATRGSLNVEEIRSRFNLTEREVQVVAEVVKGSTNQEIAEALKISEHTVKDHIKKIMNKLGVNNRTLIFCKVFE